MRFATVSLNAKSFCVQTVLYAFRDERRQCCEIWQGVAGVQLAGERQLMRSCGEGDDCRDILAVELVVES